MLLNGTVSAISASGSKINMLGHVCLIMNSRACCFSCPYNAETSITVGFSKALSLSIKLCMQVNTVCATHMNDRLPKISNYS